MLNEVTPGARSPSIHVPGSDPPKSAASQANAPEERVLVKIRARRAHFRPEFRTTAAPDSSRAVPPLLAAPYKADPPDAHKVSQIWMFGRTS